MFYIFGRFIIAAYSASRSEVLLDLDKYTVSGLNFSWLVSAIVLVMHVVGWAHRSTGRTDHVTFQLRFQQLVRFK